jgi:hypothetical protein
MCPKEIEIKAYKMCPKEIEIKAYKMCPKEIEIKMYKMRRLYVGGCSDCDISLCDAV